MGVLSPVSRDSFAAPCPLVTTASAITWSPARRITRSPLTSASGEQVFSWPVAQNVRSRGVQQGQLANGLARAKLLHRANQRVRHHDTQKQHVPPAAHQRQTNRQCHIQPVEGREEIFRQNLRGGFVGAVVGDVRLAGSRLLVRQAAWRGRGEIRRKLRVDLQDIRHNLLCS